MLSRTFHRRYASPAPAAATWTHLADPAAVAASSSHPTVAALDGPMGAGATWTEYHVDEGCDFDSVRWRCIAFETGRRIVVEGLQAGALQRSTTVLHDAPDGVEVESTLLVRLSLRAPATLSERAFGPVLLLTPFGRASLEEGFAQSVEDDQRALAALVV